MLQKLKIEQMTLRSCNDLKTVLFIAHRRRCASEMSNPEFAVFMEKQHLRNAEENDYKLMEDLIQRKYDEEEEQSQSNSSVSHNPALLHVVQESREFRNNRLLRRATAIEDDVTPTSSSSVFSELTNQIYCLTSGIVTSLMMICLEFTERQGSEDSTDQAPLMPPSIQRPTIIVDSSQLPIAQEQPRKADSRTSLHMQSETMC